MTSVGLVPIFDGHNDILLRLYQRGGTDAAHAFLEGEGKGQLDLPMAQQGGFVGGLFAIFVSSRNGANGPDGDGPSRKRSSNEYSAPTVGLMPAQQAVFGMVSLLLRIERESKGRVRSRRHTAVPEGRCVGARSSYRRSGSNRREFRVPRRIVCDGTSFARPRLEPVQCVWAWRAFSLSLVARHRTWSDGSRQGADRRLQPFGHFN
jgi:hypothetical protein